MNRTQQKNQKCSRAREHATMSARQEVCPECDRQPKLGGVRRFYGAGEGGDEGVPLRDALRLPPGVEAVEASIETRLYLTPAMHRRLHALARLHSLSVQRYTTLVLGEALSVPVGEDLVRACPRCEEVCVSHPELLRHLDSCTKEEPVL